MQITRNSTETAVGPGDWFTGTDGSLVAWGEHVTDEEYAAAQPPD